jgi:hypothetical protein
MKAQVSVSPSESGAKIRVSKSNPSQGSIVLVSEKSIVSGRWADTQTRITRIMGDVKALKVWMDAYGAEVPGQLTVMEFLESEKADYAHLLNPKKKGEEQLKYALKRAGKEGPVCTLKGERILRFTEYDPQGTMQDRLISHDNQAEIQAWRESKKSATAAPEAADSVADLPAEKPKRSRKAVA